MKNWINKSPKNTINKKPLLILLATGGAGGKGTFVSKINRLLSIKELTQIGTDNHVTVRISEEFSNAGEIVLEYEEDDFKELNSRQKREFDENLKVITKNELEWFKPENVNVQGLKQKIQGELNKRHSNKVIIVEGVHALQFSEIRELADLKIWIDADNDLRLIRKITRSPYYQEMIGEAPKDTRNFGGTLHSFKFAFESWTEGTRISEKSHVLPTKKYADLVISSDNWEEFDQGVDKVASIIDLYFKDEEKFKKEVAKEKKGRIESEISKLEEQIQARKAELSKLGTEQTTSYQQQTIIHQPPK